MHTSIPRPYLATTLGLIVAGLVLSGVLGGGGRATPGAALAGLVTLLLAVHLLLGVRALAEALVARRLGFQVTTLRAGLVRLGPGPRVRVAPRASTPGALPAEPAALRRRSALVAAAGLLTALGLAAVTVIGALAAAGPGGPVADAVLGGLAVTMAASALTELVPRWTGGPPTAGALLAAWRRRPALARRRIALDVLGAFTAAGRRPRSWAEGWVRAATEPPDGSPADALGCWYGYLWATDMDAAGLARGAIEHALAITPDPGPVRSRLLAEAAFHTARVWGDAAGAERLLDEIPDTAADRLPVIAAVTWARGDDTAAAAACRQWLALPPADSPLPGGDELRTEAVEALLAEAGQRAESRSEAG